MRGSRHLSQLVWDCRLSVFEGEDRLLIGGLQIREHSRSGVQSLFF